jgi:hypothetical protein
MGRSGSASFPQQSRGLFNYLRAPEGWVANGASGLMPGFPCPTQSPGYPSLMALAALAQEFDALPVEEQLDVVETLWERIARKPETLPTPEWHLQIVRERLAAHMDGTEGSFDWVELRKELLSR